MTVLGAPAGCRLGSVERASFHERQPCGLVGSAGRSKHEFVRGFLRDLAHERRAIRLEQRQLVVLVAGLAAQRLFLSLVVDLPGELAVLLKGQADGRVGIRLRRPGADETGRRRRRRGCLGLSRRLACRDLGRRRSGGRGLSWRGEGPLRRRAGGAAGAAGVAAATAVFCSTAFL